MNKKRLLSPGGKEQEREIKREMYVRRKRKKYL